MGILGLPGVLGTIVTVSLILWTSTLIAVGYFVLLPLDSDGLVMMARRRAMMLLLVLTCIFGVSVSLLHLHVTGPDGWLAGAADRACGGRVEEA